MPPRTSAALTTSCMQMSCISRPSTFLGRPVDVGFSYYQLTTVPFRVAGPAAWKAQIEAADWGQLAALPWIAPSNSSLAYSAMLSQLFGDKGLELNTVVRFDNAALA